MIAEEMDTRESNEAVPDSPRTSRSMTRDHRDACIELLADSECELVDRVVDLTIERDAYRVVAQHAIHALHEQHCEITRQRCRIAALCAALRACRRPTP